MKILLFGKTGQLGWELQRTLAPLGAVHSYGPDEFDLADLKELQRVIYEVKPEMIVNASAYTAVDRAEEEREIAWTINSRVPGVMAEAAKDLHAVMVHFSTDYVFDGMKGTAYTEKDATNPLNVYGQTKLEGEQAIGQVGGAHIILRTSWVYDVGGGGFVTKILSWARSQGVMRVVTDQVGSPTWARMLAEVSSGMVSRSLHAPYDYFLERSGVYHLGGFGSVSRFDFTREVLRLDPRQEEHLVKRVEPALTVDFPSPARRPLVTPLDCSQFERVFGLRLPAWEDVLKLAMEGIQ